MSQLQQKTTKNNLESLSNELLIEVFDYLDGIDIYNAFSKLNHRFDCLLACPLLNTKITLFSTSQNELDSYFNRIILPYKTRLISLFLWNNQVISRFQSHLLDRITFDNLQSLVLHRIQPEDLFSLLPCLTYLPQLFALTIHCQFQLSSIIKLYLLIFRLPVLRYNELVLNDQTYVHQPLTLVGSQQINNIQHLVLDYPCTLQLITQILFHTTQLTRFRCKKLLKSDEEFDENLVLHLPQLTQIKIASCNVNFQSLERFLRCISTHLKTLHISTSEDMTYLDVNRWEHLIFQHMPYLSKFNFEYQQIINNDFQLTTEHLKFYRSKMSAFWIEHRWLFGLKIYVSIPSDILSFTISPQSHKYIEYDPNTTPISQLIVNFISSSTQKSWFNRNIMPILFDTHFTHLDINCTMMLPSMIIDLLHVLPNLRELTISYLKLSSCTHLLRSEIIENSIERVTIKKLNEFCEFEFFSNLCRRMKTFDIGLGNHIKYETFLKQIFVENLQRNISLSTICFHIHEVNNQFVPNLQSVLQSNTSISHYSVKRRGSKVLLTFSV